VVKVYVAGLYLEQKSRVANAILKADAPKRLVMQFIRDVSKKQVADGFEESFKNNAPDAAKTMKPEIDKLLDALNPSARASKWCSLLPGHGHNHGH
jgi:signal recognition particle GTPase